MTVATAIEKIRQSGFVIEAEGDRIAIDPFDALTAGQVAWLREHKSEILAELRAMRASDALLEAGQPGNDIQPANDRVIVHVPEFTTAAGNRYSFDLSVPRANLPLLRESLRFRLHNGDGGSLLGSPGTPAEELREMLRSKYGERLESINEQPLP